MEDLKEFQNWIQRINKEIDVKAIELANLAMDENQNYSSAMYWLDKNKPDVPSSYNATPVETFSGGVVPGMFQVAKRHVNKEALKQKIARKAEGVNKNG